MDGGVNHFVFSDLESLVCSSCLRCGDQGFRQRPYHRNCNCSIHDLQSHRRILKFKRSSSRVLFQSAWSSKSTEITGLSMATRAIRRNNNDENLVMMATPGHGVIWFPEEFERLEEKN
ncbi:hypothetical protein KP509_29G013000 [Ceratopteris richardii]|uniref:Uncharacterized protein n=1 Tax=Ceratopteris richardii TaxID=49495 RepID=A0A8T2R6F8_CERRI|nr:hypothetical protein KP509_29G013000 [Ceratopteris richardii]